ncbi:MAG: hypothetical protein AAGD35_04650 [Actinomycetota bacterium]
MQWIAIAVVLVLATLAAFVFLGNGSTPRYGGHSGSAPIAPVVQSSS